MHAFLLVLLCSSFLFGCSNESDPLRIGSNRWLGYAPFYLADELGWGSLANIRLVEYPTSNGVVRGMHNGLLDAALLTLDEAIVLQSTGHNIEILLITNISAGADVLYARSSIRHTHELKGKRIAVKGGTLGAYFLSRTLEEAKLTADDVEVISLPAYMHANEFKKGSIDAAVNTSAAKIQFNDNGALPLFTSRDLHDEIFDVLVVNRERTSPELRSRLSGLWFSSLDAWLTHRDNSDKRLYRRLGLDEQSLNLTLSGLVMGDKALNGLYFEQDLLAARIQQMQAFMLDHGLLLQPIDVSKLLPTCAGDAC